MSEIFLDTNIFVYTFDGKNPQKQTCARSLVALCRERTAAVSTQVLQEFYVTVTRKSNVTRDAARAFINGLTHFDLVVIGLPEINRAIGIQERFQISFWDALIIAAAVTAGCSLLWSEDLNHGQVIDGVRIENPFRGSAAATGELLRERRASYGRKRARGIKHQ